MPCFILSPGFLLPRGHLYFLLLLFSGTQFHSPVVSRPSPTEIPDSPLRPSPPCLLARPHFF